VTILRLAWDEMRHRRSRLLSGVLAVALGIAVVVAIRSVASASEIAVAVQLDNLGANMLVLPQGASTDDYYTADIDAPTIPEEYVERIVTSALPGVDNLSPKLSRRVRVQGRDVVLTGILPSSEIAAKPAWQIGGVAGEDLKLSCDPNAAANRGHGYGDERLKRKAVAALGAAECLVGSAAAQRFGAKAGGTFSALEREWKVARVLPSTGTADDDRVFIHLRAMQDLVHAPGQVSVIEIMGCCHEITGGLLGKLRNILPDTRISTISQIVATQVETNELMRKVSLAFLLVVLLVGAVSVGNYLWANVNERRREIGVLRLLGAPRSSVYGLLLAKASFLGVMGGLAGFALGTAAALWLGPFLVGLSVRPEWPLLPLAVLAAVVVSLLGAWLPARAASRIEPFSNLQET
jgi:putative ABC transport system permease protein